MSMTGAATTASASQTLEYVCDRDQPIRASVDMHGLSRIHSGRARAEGTNTAVGATPGDARAVTHGENSRGVD